MYTIAYNMIEEFLRGLKKLRVVAHDKNKKHKKLKQKNASANLVRSKSKIQGGSPYWS